MKLLATSLHLALFVSLGSAFVLFPEDLGALLNVLYSRLPPITLGMNVTKVGVGFRLGRNVDFQTLVELGSLVTTPSPTSKRNVRQQFLSEAGQKQPDVSGQPQLNFISSLWSRRPAVRVPTRATARTKRPRVTVHPTVSPELATQLPDHDVRDNEIEP